MKYQFWTSFLVHYFLYVQLTLVCCKSLASYRPPVHWHPPPLPLLFNYLYSLLYLPSLDFMFSSYDHSFWSEINCLGSHLSVELISQNLKSAWFQLFVSLYRDPSNFREIIQSANSFLFKLITTDCKQTSKIIWQSYYASLGNSSLHPIRGKCHIYIYFFPITSDSFTFTHFQLMIYFHKSWWVQKPSDRIYFIFIITNIQTSLHLHSPSQPSFLLKWK